MESKTLKQDRKRRTFTKEFKEGAVRLVLEEGKSVADVGRDLGVHPTVIGSWVRQVRVDTGEGPPEALTTAERAELAELRKKVRVLEMERALLKKAAAFFAKENA
jgi:transposase